MAIRLLLSLGDPQLHAPVKPVTSAKQITDLVADLTDTMRKNGLVGIAATQIGGKFDVFVTEIRPTPYRSGKQLDPIRIFINTKIIDTSPETVEIYEGCGSVNNGGIFGPVNRPKSITVEAFDQNMKKFHLTCDGLLARVVQHEVDHLRGVEFIEKVADYSRLLGTEWYQKTVRDNPKYLRVLNITTRLFTDSLS